MNGDDEKMLAPDEYSQQVHNRVFRNSHETRITLISDRQSHRYFFCVLPTFRDSRTYASSGPPCLRGKFST